jgi:LacI family transcriptional regulator
MAVRLKDIAQDLGLSVVTISKALRNHPDIAEETRTRILARVKELDYQPNLMARSLVTGRSYLVGLVVPSLLHPFFAEIARSLSSVIGRQGYSLILASSEEDPELEAREIQQMTARRLDALVIATSGFERGPLDRLQANGMPYVLIDREISGLEANFVGVDDIAVGSMATEHLIEQGCQRIAHIRGRDNSTGLRRYEGYRRAMQRAGRELSEDLVVARPSVDVDSIRMGAEAMRMLLRRKPRPDAVFAYNDPLAIGAMEAILNAGLRIPEDVAVIGCGNLHYNESLRVPLSSIDQRSSLIGERTAAILLHAIAAKTPPRPVSVILEPSLAVRDSSLKKTRKQPAARSMAKDPAESKLPRKSRIKR